jgi:hypothetical protein
VSNPVTRVLGVYDADGGLRGEAAYVVGRLLGRHHCSLCDVTHSPVRRRRAWDELVATLPVPVRLAHRNELTAAEERAGRAAGLPVVLGEHADGTWSVLVGPAALEEAHGSVAVVGGLLRAALARHDS